MEKGKIEELENAIVDFARIEMQITKEANSRRGVTKRSLKLEANAIDRLLRLYGLEKSEILGIKTRILEGLNC
jgi:hypothetical protein